MLLELNGICFFVKSLKHISSNNSFDVSKYISFSHNQTRSGSYKKLVQPFIKHNTDKQFYFNRLPHLWNSLSLIDLSLAFGTLEPKLNDISFLAKFDPNNSCAYTITPAHAQAASLALNHAFYPHQTKVSFVFMYYV